MNWFSFKPDIPLSQRRIVVVVVHLGSKGKIACSKYATSNSDLWTHIFQHLQEHGEGVYVSYSSQTLTSEISH